jgi:3-phenylpropionate/trans-cinnamate dioxygenase ferredoxin component
MSGHRITVCRRDGPTPGGARRFDVEGAAVAMVRIDDEVYADGDRCTHRGVSLAEREVDKVERLLECSKHGSQPHR